MSLPLCKYCHSIRLTNDSAYHPHYSSASALLASAAGGCPLCTILCDAFRHTPWPAKTNFGKDATKFHFYIENDPFTNKREPTVFFLVEFLNREMNGALKWNGKRGTRERFEVYVPVLIVPAADANTVTPRSALSRSTDSVQCQELANRWLVKCTETHSKCRHPTSSPSKRMPTRLLDVGVDGKSTIRLHLTDGNLSKDKYITLSHCWGSAEIPPHKDYRLTVNTLEPMRSSIATSTLPKTFQDAIKLTRQLGVRYLWIDSLCIIQEGDKKEDWNRESSMMGSVYQNGYCNIAATAASDGTAGCFRPREPLLAQPCTVEFEKGLKKFGLKKGVYDLIPQRLWEEGLSQAPLLKRAWVVQERVLARRVLHFARNQLFWECEELDACEMYPAGAPSSLVQFNSKGSITGGQEYSFKNLQFKNLDPSSVRSEVQVVKTPWTYSVIPKLPSGPQIDPYYVWNKVVIAFTRCDISYETDKLVAISAIARQVQVMAKDVYLAGLWKRYLPYHLMWATKKGSAPKVRERADYAAPSWSWASKIAFIEPYAYIRPDYPPMIRILSAGTVPKTSDTTGQVISGHLRLRGWLRKFRVTNPPPTVELFKGPTVSNTVDFDVIEPDGEREVWFLPVVALGPWVTYEALGLLLHEETNRDGEFKRVGRFRASEDVAKKFFRRPTYPPESENEQPGGNSTVGTADLDSGERRGWFGNKKKIDGESCWKEQIITII